MIIKYPDRPDGSQSKLNTYSDGFKVLVTIAHLFRSYRPMVYFSIISGILTLLSLIFFIPVVIEYGQTGLVERFPTLIVCGFAFMAALFSFYARVILQTIRQKDRQDFEMQLQAIEARKRTPADPSE